MVSVFALGFNAFGQIVQHGNSYFCTPTICYNLQKGNDVVPLLCCSWSKLLISVGQKIRAQGLLRNSSHSHDEYDISQVCDHAKQLVTVGEEIAFLTERGNFVLSYQSKLSSAEKTSSANLRLDLSETRFKALASRFNCYKIILSTDDNKILTLQRSPKSNSFSLSSQMKMPVSVLQLSCGKSHHLILTDCGAVYSWGIGSRGELGHPDCTETIEPMLVESLGGVKIRKVCCGGWHSAALADTNDLYTWGWNESGQTGFPAPKNSFVNSLYTNLQSNASLSQELEEHASDQKSSSDARCSKRLKISTAFNEQSQNEIYQPVGVVSTPLLLELENHLQMHIGFVSVVDVSCGSRHTAAVLDSGEVVTWGWGKYGQLGQACCQETPLESGKNCLNLPHLPGFLRGLDCAVKINKVECGLWSTYIIASSSKHPT